MEWTGLSKAIESKPNDLKRLERDHQRGNEIRALKISIVCTSIDVN